MIFRVRTKIEKVLHIECEKHCEYWGKVPYNDRICAITMCNAQVIHIATPSYKQVKVNDFG